MSTKITNEQEAICAFCRNWKDKRMLVYYGRFPFHTDCREKYLVRKRAREARS